MPACLPPRFATPARPHPDRMLSPATQQQRATIFCRRRVPCGLILSRGLLRSTDDEDFRWKTHSAICGVTTQRFERLALHLSQLRRRKLGDLFAKLLTHLAPDGPKLFDGDRRFDSELQQPLAGIPRASLAKNVP